MFSLFKKQPFLTIQQDIHAHVLPGIDDGPKNIEAALAMVRKFHELGYQQITATPHVFWEYYPNSEERIRKRHRELVAAVKAHQIPITINVAAEYYLDEHFSSLLNDRKLLPLFGKSVLVECDMLEPTPNLGAYIFNTQIKGYQPILAHPERYLYLEEKDYAELRKKECQFQINILSFLGHYGAAVQKRAKFLLRYLDSVYLGTDAHHVQHLEKIQSFIQSTRFQKLLRNTTLLNHSITPTNV